MHFIFVHENVDDIQVIFCLGFSDSLGATCQSTPFSLCTTHPEQGKLPCLLPLQILPPSLHSLHWLSVSYSKPQCWHTSLWRDLHPRTSRPATPALQNTSPPSLLCVTVQEDAWLLFATKSQVITCSLLFPPSGIQMVTALCSELQSHSLSAVVGFEVSRSNSYHPRVSESYRLFCSH